MRQFIVVKRVRLGYLGFMSAPETGRMRHAVGPLLGLAALLVYAVTLSRGAYPGLSASLIVQYTGLFPLTSPFYPLWGSLVRFLSWIPLGGLAFRLNALSMVCGAVAVWFLYEVVSGAVYAAVRIHEKNRRRVTVASMLAGAAASVFLAFCIPFWMVSTRAHPAAFDVLLLLGATRLLLAFVRTGRQRFALWFAAIYGLGVVEFATFILLAPVFAVFLLGFLWREDKLKPGLVVRIVLCGAAGLCLYFVAAWRFYGTAGHAIRGYPGGYFRVLWFLWRDQFFLISRSLPPRGWLIVLFISAVPWLASLIVGGRALNEEKDWAYYFLHVVLTGLVVGILLNMRLAPWPMLGESHLLVTPYVLTASAFGYLVAYWYLLPAAWWPETERPWKLWINRWLGPLLVLPLLGLTAIAPFRNAREADGRGARGVNRFAAEMMRSAQGRTWLVTDGSVDSHLLIAAEDAGRRVRVINLHEGENPIYLRYVATLFESPRMRNLAQMGLLPMLEEWFTSDPDIADKAAVMNLPDLWLSAGLTAVPCRTVFLGVREPAELDPDGILASHETFWSGPVVEALAAGSEEDSLADLTGHLRRQISLVANNVGVLMEDLGREDAAGDCYLRAREIYPDNLSALLNLGAMAERGRLVAEAEEIRKELEELIVRRSGTVEIWSLARYYGYVRAPEAFAETGWTWALSGRPGIGVSELKRALEMATGAQRDLIKERLATTYLMQDQDAESELLYYELLVEDPSNPRALLGLAQIAMRGGDVEKAGEFLRKAEDAGVSESRMALSWAALDVFEGELDEARAVLEKLLEDEPSRLEAWVMLADVLAAQGDRKALETCLERIQGLDDGQGYVVAAARGELALIQNDWEHARQNYEKALTFQPDNPALLSRILQLDLIENLRREAREHARRILRLNPGHAMANFTVGSLQIFDGEYAQAEDSLRRSLERAERPETLNNLAWVLRLRGRLPEAEECARASLALDEDNPDALDTLGVILMEMGRLNEAEPLLERALLLSQNKPEIFLNMARLQVQQGENREASKVLDMLSERPDLLSRESREDLDSLRREIRGN